MRDFFKKLPRKQALHLAYQTTHLFQLLHFSCEFRSALLTAPVRLYVKLLRVLPIIFEHAFIIPVYYLLEVCLWNIFLVLLPWKPCIFGKVYSGLRANTRFSLKRPTGPDVPSVR